MRQWVRVAVMRTGPSRGPGLSRPWGTHLRASGVPPPHHLSASPTAACLPRGGGDTGALPLAPSRRPHGATFPRVRLHPAFCVPPRSQPGRGPVAAETLQVGDPAVDTALREWHRIRTCKASTPGCRARGAGARVRMQTCPRPPFRDHGWLPRRSCVGPGPGVKEGWVAGARGRLAHLSTSLEERLNIRINPPICSE